MAKIFVESAALFLSMDVSWSLQNTDSGIIAEVGLKVSQWDHKKLQNVKKIIINSLDGLCEKIGQLSQDGSLAQKQHRNILFTIQKRNEFYHIISAAVNSPKYHKLVDQIFDSAASAKACKLALTFNKKELEKLQLYTPLGVGYYLYFVKRIFERDEEIHGRHPGLEKLFWLFVTKLESIFHVSYTRLFSTSLLPGQLPLPLDFPVELEKIILSYLDCSALDGDIVVTRLTTWPEYFSP